MAVGLTVFRREGVISSVQTEHRYGGLLQFGPWTSMLVIICAGLEAKHYRCEALVKLPDGARLEGGKEG